LANDFSLLGKKIVNLRTISKTDLVIPVFAEMRASTNVFELSRPLGRHVLIQEQDINEIRRDLTFMPKGFIRNKNDILGKKYSLSLAFIDSKKSKKWNTVKSVYAKEKDVKSAISNMSLKQEIKNKFKVVVFVREN
jgi:hypothetical protein